MDKNDLIRDFHLHTMYSDGLYPPNILVEEAYRQGVNDLAITDHNSIAGIPEGMEAAAKLGINLVAGVEMSTRYRDVETHILGYGFNLDRVTHSSPLYEYILKIRDADDVWVGKVVGLSQKKPIVVDLGGGRKRCISIHEDELDRFGRSTKPSYFHIGILVKDKLDELSPEFKKVPARHVFYFLFWRKEPEYIRKYEPLFRKYGIENKKYWHVPRDESSLLPIKRVIEMLLHVGAAPVIAHPGESNLTEREIEEIAKMGAMGLEVYTPKHDEEQTIYYKKIADCSGLFRISGTDFHDPYHRNRVEIGRDRYGRKLTKGVTAEDLRRISRLSGFFSALKS